MSLAELVDTACSLLSLVVTLFVASQVVKIRQSISQSGSDNVAAGRDAHVRR